MPKLGSIGDLNGGINHIRVKTRDFR
jgi:hypothetical protein